MFFHELWSSVLIWLLKNKQRKLIWKLYSAYSGMRYQSRIQFYKVSKSLYRFHFVISEKWGFPFFYLKVKKFRILFTGRTYKDGQIYYQIGQQWCPAKINKAYQRDKYNIKVHLHSFVQLCRCPSLIRSKIPTKVDSTNSAIV